MYKRPNSNEDVDEILRQQEDFLKKNNLPKKESIFKKRAKKIKTNPIHENIPSSTLGEIKEKKYNKSEINDYLQKEQIFCKKGFPPTDFILVDDNPNDPRCLFEQNLKYNPHIKEFMITALPQTQTSLSQSQVISSSCIQDLGKKSFIIKNEESDLIHKENILKLTQMTHEERLAERDHLSHNLDPSLINFLLSKRASKVKKHAVKNSIKEEEDENNMDTDPPIVSEILGNKQANTWVNMKVVEKNKLEWTRELPNVSLTMTNEPYPARFDFKGDLMPFSSNDIPINAGLNHHGEDPDRPGYTIQELLELTRSAVIQQRLIALKSLGAVIEKAQLGIYDASIEEPMFPELINSGLYFILRVSLDKNVEMIISSSLVAIQNILKIISDEICLDKLNGSKFGIIQPSLSPKFELNEPEEKELKDIEILKLDLIRGVMRTDLISRIKYILSTIKPSSKGVLACLNILTRIVRHSFKFSQTLFQSKDLILFIIENFLPVNYNKYVSEKNYDTVYNVPLSEALKLLRVLSARSRMFTSDLINKYHVLAKVEYFIHFDLSVERLLYKEGMKLVLEAFYFLETVLCYNFNLASECFKSISSHLIKLLNDHYQKTNIYLDESNTQHFLQEHLSAILSCLSKSLAIVHYWQNNPPSGKIKPTITLTLNDIDDFLPIIIKLCKKSFGQLKQYESFDNSGLKPIASLLDCLSTIISIYRVHPNTDLFSFMKLIDELLRDYILNFLNSNSFNLLTKNLRTCSSLLDSNPSGQKRFPDCLPSLYSLTWEGEIIGPIREESPFIFLTSLFSFIINVNENHMNQVHEINDIMNSTNIVDYIKQIVNNKLYNINNWFTKIEINFLVNVLLITKFQKPKEKYIYQLLPFKLIHLIPSSDKILMKKLMNEFIFNSELFNEMTLLDFHLENLHISNTSNCYSLIKKSTDNLISIKSCYNTCLGFDKISEPSILEITKLTLSEEEAQPYLPEDWAYLPLINIYNKDKSSESASPETISTVTKVLQWILLTECLILDPTTCINITSRFCRLYTIFLSASDLFLDSSIEKYLKEILNQMIKYNNKFNFNNKIKGLASFYDLYTLFLEQIAACSYGSEIFSSYALIPLQMRHSVSFRKMLWSEHACCLRIINTSIKEISSIINEYLYPIETDCSMLMSYLTCLATGTIKKEWSPVLYRMALHHVASYIQQHNETNFGKKLKDHVLKLKNQDLTTSIINYKKEESIDFL